MDQTVHTADSLGSNPLEDTNSDAAIAYADERRDNIRTFVRTSPDYYITMFDKIGASSRFTPTFNLMAGLFGPIWFGARGLWNWALPFLILEALAFVQIARGLFGDLGADAMARIASIEGTLELRRQQLAAAIENNSDRVDAFQKNGLIPLRRTSAASVPKPKPRQPWAPTSPWRAFASS